MASVANPQRVRQELDHEACLVNAEILLTAGVKHVVVKMGSEGALLVSTTPLAGGTPSREGTTASGLFWQQFSALPVTRVIDVTGAGDSLVGGTVAALLRQNPAGKSLSAALPFGLVAAQLSLQSSSPVSPFLTPSLFETSVSDL